MKVFISWSGELSKKVAELLNEWIPSVLQNVEPWISTEDIEKGEIWFGAITDKMADVSVGIICLTRDNMNAPWILFEAGALSKGLTKNRVCTLLIDLEANDLKPPLGQFNATRASKEEMAKLLKTINCSAPDKEKPLDDLRVQAAVERWWPEFYEKLKIILTTTPKVLAVKKRPPEEISDEILTTVRSMHGVLQELKPARLERSLNELTEMVWAIKSPRPGAGAVYGMPLVNDLFSNLHTLCLRNGVKALSATSDSKNFTLRCSGVLSDDLLKTLTGTVELTGRKLFIENVP